MTKELLQECKVRIMDCLGRPGGADQASVLASLLLAEVINDLAAVADAAWNEVDPGEIIPRARGDEDSDVVQLHAEAEALMGGETLDENEFASYLRK